MRALIDGKAKPVGAFGRLETLALQIGLIRGTLAPAPPRPHAIVFAGDHGLTAEGVTAYPSAVTREVARLVLKGRAGISVCVRAAGMDVTLVDAGLLAPLEPAPMLTNARIGPGTANSRRGPAMTTAERNAALRCGSDLARTLCSRSRTGGFDTLVLGEIGIGNTSAAALLAHAVTGIALDVLVGPGAGLRAAGLAHKRTVIAETFARTPTRDAQTALAEFAGFEMVMLTGAILGAAEQQALVVIDGFIATACAATACALRPTARDYCVFAHSSAEPGHQALLQTLGAEPLLDLGLRLGEGTGAALAIPLIRVATAMLSDMANLSDVIGGGDQA